MRVLSADSQPIDLENLRQRFQAYGQAHVFDFWDELAEPEQAALLRQAQSLSGDLPDLVEAAGTAARQLDAAPDDLALEPYDAIPLPEHGGDESRFEAARRRGLALLEAGRVGVCVVAGGQGTRLGFSGPKGAFPVGPVSERNLFGLHAQKIRGLGRRSGRTIPWYVMTSPATDAETRALFEAEDFFGFGREDVFIFCQGTLPAWDFEGRLILDLPGRIAESPNGHGGALTALDESGALDHMAARGIDRLFYFQVDNPLVRMGDPVFLGFHDACDSEMSCKVIRKVDPLEKVGVVARSNGRPAVVEYTELSQGLRDARDDQGRLLYWAGNIAIHVFNLDFLRRVTREGEKLLPVHASPKIIPSAHSRNKERASEAPNGYKLERFVFDALPWAERVCVLEVSAAEEFSPIKNAEGSQSPESSRADLEACYRRWLEEAGVEIPPGVLAIEIDHSVIDSAAEALEANIGTPAAAGQAILFSTGSNQ